MAASFQRFFILIKLIENLLNFTSNDLIRNVLDVSMWFIIKIRNQYIRNIRQLLELFHIHPFAAYNHTLIYNGRRRHTLKSDSQIILYTRLYQFPVSVGGYRFCYTRNGCAVSDIVSRFYSSNFKIAKEIWPLVPGKSYHTDQITEKI